MPAHQLIGPMPGLTLDAGCMVTAEAIDPATGATVSGVTISALTVYGVNVVPGDSGSTGPDAMNPEPPIYVSLEDESEVMAAG